MSGVLSFIPHSASQGGDLLHRAHALVDRLVAEWRLQHDLRTLGELGPEGLKDIGLTEGAIEGAVRHGRGRSAHMASSPSHLGSLMPASWTEWR